ncbi:MAG TPA: response regulator transcription factor [Solirubrobacterales bacterium]
MAEEGARVAVVEDEDPIREAVVQALRSDGFATAAFSDFADPEILLATAPDLAVLDVRLPSGDGFELARRLRARRPVAVMFLTARDTVADRIAGLDLGADDYLVKPFAIEELLARVRAVLRRTGKLAEPLQAGELLIDEQTGEAWRAGDPLGLTATELRLLAFLFRHRGAVLSKDQLLTQVWGYEAYDPNLVEVHVSALRRKLGSPRGGLLMTVRGMGYRLDVG